MAGRDLLTMDAPTMLNVLYSLIVDESTNPEESRADTRGRVDEWLADSHSAVANIDDTTWGTLPSHQAGLDNAMSMVGDMGGAPS